MKAARVNISKPSVIQLLPKAASHVQNLSLTELQQHSLHLEEQEVQAVNNLNSIH